MDGEILDNWLEGESIRHRNQRLTAKRVFERLGNEHGFAGGYTIVKNDIREAILFPNQVFAAMPCKPADQPRPAYAERSVFWRTNPSRGRRCPLRLLK